MTSLCDLKIEIFESTSCSNVESERPFKLLVKNEVFTIDSEKLRKLSPIFAVMCFGRDFENGRELAREIVDEKSNDIAVFLKCLHNKENINGN
uniref:BTB domain-containing protein n=1 Tax=Panagrolaimus sp. JU765 TaxID=591449 RepID=A0AC34RT92_9BILA